MNRNEGNEEGMNDSRGLPEKIRQDIPEREEETGESTPLDIDEEKARLIVEQLIEDSTVSMPPDEPILIHQPSGAVFESAVNLAHFHWGWVAQ